MSYNRRNMFKWGAATAWAACTLGASGAWPRAARGQGIGGAEEEDDDDCGVASGSPTLHSVVLWTRVPKHAHPAAGTADFARVDVHYEVSLDDSFSSQALVARGTVVTDARRDHTVKVRVEGLRPGTIHYYRFHTTTGYESIVGRTKTAPEARSPVTFATVSCQDFTNGHYTVYQALARDDVDFVAHLGDHVYEGAKAIYQRKQIRADPVAGGAQVRTLEEFRAKHRHYLSDPHYREARARFAWIDLWDDHEVHNNYFGTDTTPSEVALRHHGFRAFLEYMPVDLDPDDFRAPQAYRKVSYGELCDLFVLDERQYRDGPACDRDVVDFGCKRMFESDRTMLGEAQRNWFKDALRTSDAHWKIVLHEVMMAPLRVLDLPRWLAPRVKFALGDEGPTRVNSGPDLLLNTDSWDGYPAERLDLLDMIARDRVGNVIFCAGDIHACFASELRMEGARGGRRTPLAVEITTGSVSSLNFQELIGDVGIKALAPILSAGNPHFKYFDLRTHAYTKVTLAEDAATVRYVGVDTVDQPFANAFLLKTLIVPSGQPRIVSAR